MDKNKREQATRFLYEVHDNYSWLLEMPPIEDAFELAARAACGLKVVEGGDRFSKFRCAFTGTKSRSLKELAEMAKSAKVFYQAARGLGLGIGYKGGQIPMELLDIIALEKAPAARSGPKWPFFWRDILLFICVENLRLFGIKQSRNDEKQPSNSGCDLAQDWQQSGDSGCDLLAQAWQQLKLLGYNPKDEVACPWPYANALRIYNKAKKETMPFAQSAMLFCYFAIHIGLDAVEDGHNGLAAALALGGNRQANTSFNLDALTPAGIECPVLLAGIFHLLRGQEVFLPTK